MDLTKIYQEAIEHLDNVKEWKGILDQFKAAMRYSLRKDEFRFYLFFSRLLHYYYTIVLFDKKRSLLYKGHLKRARDLINLETDIHLSFCEIASRINRGRKLDKKGRKLLEDFVSQYSYVTEYNNHTFNLYYYPLFISKLLVDGEILRAINVSQEAITFFESKKSVKVYVFYGQMVPGLQRIGEWQKALEMSRQAQRKVIGSRFTVSVYIYYEVVSLVHLGRYNDALERIKIADRKRQVNPEMIEEWKIVKSYFNILGKMGIVDRPGFKRLSSLINDVRIFEKDKQGNFLNLLIIKLLDGILSQKDKIIDHRNKLTLSAWRHSVKGTRKEIFIRMLLNLVSNYYNYEKARKETDPLFEKLKTMPMSVENIEIVPYELLFTKAVESLKTKNYATV